MRAGRSGALGLLEVAGLAVGLYAMAPFFVGPAVHTTTLNELVDHVVPGLVVEAMAVPAVWSRVGGGRAMMGRGLVVLLAGVWMAAAHVGLVVQALHHQAVPAAAGFHASTACAVLALGLAWLWCSRVAPGAFRAGADGRERRPAASSR